MKHCMLRRMKQNEKIKKYVKFKLISGAEYFSKSKHFMATLLTQGFLAVVWL